jgi:hypothetical protein
MKKLLFFLTVILISVSCNAKENVKNDTQEKKRTKAEWVSLFNGKNLDGFFIYGKATWDVRDGILTGDGGMGHIYTETVATDFVVKGTFRASDNCNSGLYFRAYPPEDNVDGWPEGYEAQIDNHQDAHTAWIWLPRKPTAKANKLITKDNEWFTMKVKMVGENMKVWVNGELMTEFTHSKYSKGHFAIQGHNPGQIIEIKELKYKDLSKN